MSQTIEKSLPNRENRRPQNHLKQDSVDVVFGLLLFRALSSCHGDCNLIFGLTSKGQQTSTDSEASLDGVLDFHAIERVFREDGAESGAAAAEAVGALRQSTESDGLCCTVYTLRGRPGKQERASFFRR